MADVMVPKVAPTRMIGSFRLAHSFLVCLGSMCIVMTQSTLMSFAIVCMTRSHSSCHSSEENNTTESTCYSNTTQENIGEFDWDNDVKGRIMGSSFYGLLGTQLLGGVISNRIGGGKVLVVSAGVICGLITLVSPLVVRYSVNLFFFLRLCTGAAFGLYIPSKMPLMAPWCVPAEQGFLVGFAYAGFSLAATVNNPVSGFLCKNYGWPAIFYFNGSLALSWAVLAFFLIYNTPEAHPFISEAEKNYIVSNRRHSHNKKPRVPWKAILTSWPIWAVIVTTFFYFAGHLSVLLYQPTYMREVLNVGVEENGVMSSVSTICALIVHFLVGPFFDCVRASNKFSLSVTRKMFNSFGLFFPALSLVALSQLPSGYKYVPVALLASCLSGTEFAIGGGFGYAILDMAPQYTGVLEGIKATISNTPGFFMPVIISSLTKNGTSQEWSYVLLILAGMYAIGGLIFLLFSSSDLQPWAANNPATSLKSKPSEGKLLKNGLSSDDV